MSIEVPFDIGDLMLLRKLTFALAVASASVGVAAEGRKSLADKHGPAGIMGDHLHEPGEWMVEYKFMLMSMEDNLIGKDKVSDAEAIGPPGMPAGINVDGVMTNAGAAPTNMTMEMHMLHVMYGYNEDVTLYSMLMLPSLTMDHIRGDMNPAGRGSSFTTHNSGFGDTSFGALLRMYSDECQDWIANLGCSVPTGDIYRESTIPTGGAASQALPYPMRLGSGTFNFKPGLTYKRFGEWWSLGYQFQTDLPIGRNYRGYSVGDEFRFNSWTSVLLTDNWAVSLRGEHLWRTAFDGEDPATANMVIATNVEDFRGGYWYNIGIGTQFMKAGHYFNFEFVPTVAQDLDGIQLETDYSVIASWSKAW
ncbi:transporter [Roseiconus lacunae]|uniref:Transporter n=1 Tax=Roseiconus lacunae TaxID=2605694 RepID=A0ABT7PK04_9BACT|nr:transporter [Roseiconus lacunae]MDM4016827.1 transporter [Roseiconus lacunae]